MVRRVPLNRGTGLFGDSEAETTPTAAATWRANIDGGSRGNPGPASYGVVIRNPRGEIVARLKKYIGRTTNNVAEYYGLIAALDYAQSQNIRALRIESDSELMVKQMRGQYKVKSEDLKPLYERAKKMSQTIANFRIEHVYRAQNKEADALANEAMDEVSGKSHASTEDRPSFFDGKKLSASDLNQEQEFSRGSHKLRGYGEAGSAAARSETIKVLARFRSGVLYPLEDINLPDGTEVEILLRAKPK